MELRRTRKGKQDSDSPKVASKRAAAKARRMSDANAGGFAGFSGFNSTQEEFIKKMVREIAYDHIIDQADKLAQQKLDQMMMQIPSDDTKSFNGDRRYIKFTTKQLLALFGGWFVLRYAFTTKETVSINGIESEVETDYWMCYKDVAVTPGYERQMRNEPIFKRFGIEVYGYVLIAPASAFDGDNEKE